MYAIYRDITERKLWEEQIRSSEKKYRQLSTQLSETNSLKDLLLDIITHDLKNPAGVISGMAEILCNDTSDDESARLIKGSSEDLLNVIDNATTLSRITIGYDIDKEEIEINQFIRKIADEFKPSFAAAGMEFESRLEDEIIITANPIIAEVFRNYFSNAIKYAASGKQIIVDQELAPDFVTIKISDLGETIAEENRRLIFRRSIQLENGVKRGRGLGLAIVERIATVHNAMVWVEANSPQGNSFCFKIARQ